MAKELFLNQFLSEQMILAGEELIKKLDESKGKVQAAFWLLNPEEKTWRLIIISPLVNESGYRNYYKRIFSINDNAKADELIISPHNIEVDDTNNNVVKYLKRNFFERSIYGNNILNGAIYSDNMYLYRIDFDLLENNIPKTSLTA